MSIEYLTYYEIFNIMSKLSQQNEYADPEEGMLSL
jgi:hypothetical protein